MRREIGGKVSGSVAPFFLSCENIRRFETEGSVAKEREEEIDLFDLLSDCLKILVRYSGSL